MSEPVLVYVGGSIAAFKACDVVTELRKRDHPVRVAMTHSATTLVAPLTFQGLSGAPVLVDLFRDPAPSGMAHLELASWCSCQVAVAVSADLIARLAHGLADDAVTTVALACRAPLVIAPAMETAMWDHPATRENV